jgi:hypothetical protein
MASSELSKSEHSSNQILKQNQFEDIERERETPRSSKSERIRIKDEAILSSVNNGEKNYSSEKKYTHREENSKLEIVFDLTKDEVSDTSHLMKTDNSTITNVTSNARARNSNHYSAAQSDKKSSPNRRQSNSGTKDIGFYEGGNFSSEVSNMSQTRKSRDMRSRNDGSRVEPGPSNLKHLSRDGTEDAESEYSLVKIPSEDGAPDSYFKPQNLENP